MATGKIKISQLTELVSASLNTTLVGVDNGVTYKMELDTLADAITSIVNTSDRSRISALEAETGSYLTSLPNGLVSQSTDLSSLNTFTESIDSRIDSLEAVTSSYLTSLDGAISGAGQISDLGFVTGSYTTINSFNSLTQSFNSISQSFNVISGSVVSIQGGFDTGSYQTFTASVNTSISNLNSATSSYETTGRGIWSGSAQLPSGIVSGSAQTISNLPTGVVSGSSQLTSSFDTRYAISASFVSSSNLSSIQTITSASYAALTPVSGTLYIIIG